MIPISLILSASSVTASTQEFSGTLTSGDSIEMDDYTFIVTMNKYANAIFIDAGTMFQTVAFAKCKKMENFEICFRNTTYDEEENDLLIELEITRFHPVITISKRINDTELYVGQEAEVTITIENTGDPASQIIMSDDYPASIQIYDIEGGCMVHENQVYWQGHLDAGGKKECRFFIKGTEELHQSFVAYLKYWDGFKWEEKYSTTMTLDFEPVLTLKSAVVREDYEVDGREFDFDDDTDPGVVIGETLRLLVNITNEYSDKISVDNLEINLPDDLVYRATGNLRFNYINASGNRSSIVWSSATIRRVGEVKLRWSGTLDGGKSKLFILKLQAVGTGDQNVLMNADYTYDDIKMSSLEYNNFEVSDPGFNIFMTFNDRSKRFGVPQRLDDEDDSIDIESMHPYDLKVYVQNRNPYATLKDVGLIVYTDIAGFKPVHYPLIEEEGSRIPYSLVLIPPALSENKEFKTNVSIKYTNEFGEQHENSTEFLLTVNSFKDITISFDSSEGTVLEGGTETTIKLTITNDRLIDIPDVSVRDIIPVDFHVEGIHAKKVKLNRETDTEIYTYVLTPPRVYNKTRYDITTSVSFFDNDLRQNITLNYTEPITVEPLEPELDVDMTLDVPDTIYPGSIIPAEYTIRNAEETELIRDITVYFPVQNDVDLIGPKSLFIDKLDPGEEVIIKNLIKLRPKVVNEAQGLNATIVEFYDNYGNLFTTNGTADTTLNVKYSRISGPALFARTIVPAVTNVSTDGVIQIEISNDGSTSADMTVYQGQRAWNTTVPAGSKTKLQYASKYSTPGNYTIPDPEITFDFQGAEAHMKGSGAVMSVELLLVLPPEVEETVVEQVIKPEPEKEEMSFEDYELIASEIQKKKMVRYVMMAILAAIVFSAVLIYVEYQRKKLPTHPFMEGENQEGNASDKK
ncbi:MAG: hypothetical protein V1729_01705 [Candidatus Woesearchaeota archaeon]